MLRTNFYINDKRIKEPLNYKELSIELNFDKDDPSFNGQVSTNSWSIGVGADRDSQDGANIIKTYINAGLTGGLGVFEGIPFRIELENNGDRQNLFNGYLDLSEAEVLCDRINAKAVETGGVDWFNEVVDSFTFEYLARPASLGGAGTITKDDYILVPYVLSSIPDTQQLFTLTLSAFIITQELFRSIQEWQEWSIAFTADYLEFGNLVTLILLTAKNILLLIALIKLIDQIIQSTVQPIKYQGSMLLSDLCKKGAEQLGYEFASDILNKHPYNKLALIPESYNQQQSAGVAPRKIKDIWQDYTQGVTDIRDSDRTGYFKGTFGDLLRELKSLFNAKIFIDNGVLRLERIDYNLAGVDLFRIPNVDRSDIPTRFNYEDLKSLYSVGFSIDNNDKNTYQNWAGNEVQIITKPKSWRYTQNILSKGEDIRKTRFARGTRKTELTFVEKFINEFITDVDRVVGRVEKVINASLQLVNLLLAPVLAIIDLLDRLGIKVGGKLKSLKPLRVNWRLRDRFNPRARIGALSMENDFIGVSKLVLLTVTKTGQPQRKIKLHRKNQDFVNASYIYDNFHNINSFAGATNNQQKIYTLDNIPFCLEDYNKVKRSNVIIEADGVTKGNVISLKWNVYNQTASITYRVNKKYTDNLKETKIITDGK